MAGNATDVADGIAIVGLAGRFPGAANVAQFWRNLCDGVESVSFFTDDELEASGIDTRGLAPKLRQSAGHPRRPGLVRRGVLRLQPA